MQSTKTMTGCVAQEPTAEQARVIELELPMPVSPSSVSGISASHFRNCQSLDELWIFQVGPATLKDLTGRKSETQALPPRCRHAHSFRILSWNSASRPRFFFHHIVAQVRASIWHFENSSPLLWNPRYSEKGDLPEHFASTFSFVMPFSHESEHAKLMTLLIINLLLAVFYWQSPSREVIDKSQGDLNSSSSSFSLCALPGRFQLRDFFSKFPFRFSVCLFGRANYFILFVIESSKRRRMIHPWNCSPAPSSVGFNSLIISQRLLFEFSFANPATSINEDHLFSKLSSLVSMRLKP